MHRNLICGLLTGLVVVTACNPKGGDETIANTTTVTSATETDGGSETMGTTDTTGGNTTKTSEPTATATETAAETDTTPMPDMGCSFLTCNDQGPEVGECSVWEQDCPAGEKCMPWANDGGGAWNATKCSPVDPEPKTAGEACTVEGSGVSGVDDCGKSAMCWDVDAETNMGVCVDFCTGSEMSPSCDDPETTCVIANGGVLILCLPGCDPLLQTCPDGQGCYPINGGFTCAPDASGEPGAVGDPCEYINVCNPGLFCADPNFVPNCMAGGCCAEFCDLGQPQCTLPETKCVAFYTMDPPPGYEELGACLIPQ